MYQINQSGRSMVEMLGVLSVAGILTVGGFSVVHNAMQAREEAQLISDTAQLGALAKRKACQYDTQYSSYTKFLYRSDAIPAGLEYNASEDQIEGALDSVTKITGDDKYFVVSVEGLDESSCVKMATTDWGKRNSNGCLGVSIGASNMKECMTSGDCNDSPSAASSSNKDKYPMSLEAAAGNSGCSGNNNTVKIWFKGCH